MSNVQSSVQNIVAALPTRRSIADGVRAVADALDPLVRVRGGGAVLGVQRLEAGAVRVHRDAVDRARGRSRSRPRPVPSQAVSAVSRTFTQRDWPSGTTTCVTAPGSGTALTELVAVGEASVLTMLVWFGPHAVVIDVRGRQRCGGRRRAGCRSWANARPAVAASVAAAPPRPMSALRRVVRGTRHGAFPSGWWWGVGREDPARRRRLAGVNARGSPRSSCCTARGFSTSRPCEAPGTTASSRVRQRPVELDGVLDRHLVAVALHHQHRARHAREVSGRQRRLDRDAPVELVLDDGPVLAAVGGDLAVPVAQERVGLARRARSSPAASPRGGRRRRRTRAGCTRSGRSQATSSPTLAPSLQPTRCDRPARRPPR